jgi:hypothetical protein
MSLRSCSSQIGLALCFVLCALYFVLGAQVFRSYPSGCEKKYKVQSTKHKVHGRTLSRVT